jgi:beta-glucosidase
MLRQEKMNFARGAAADGIVLLKNENGALPLDINKEIALFGTCAYRCFRLGWGSGDMMAQSISQINEGLKDAGYKIDGGIEAFYNITCHVFRQA